MMSTKNKLSNERHDLEAAAKLIGVSKITLRRMANKREISHVRVGTGRGRYKFTDEHIQKYLEERTFEANRQTKG